MTSMVTTLMLSFCTLFNGIIQGSADGHPKPHKPKQLLVTGWYYVSDKPNNYSRQVDRTNQVYYIDPTPIVVVKQFKKMEVSEARFMNKPYPVLLIHFDSAGTRAWSEATARATHNKLAFIMDNRLIIAPTVNSKIDNGVAAVNGDNYSQQALKAMIHELDMEMK